MRTLLMTAAALAVLGSAAQAAEWRSYKEPLCAATDAELFALPDLRGKIELSPESINLAPTEAEYIVRWSNGAEHAAKLTSDGRWTCLATWRDLRPGA